MIERMEQVTWTLFYLTDLDADFARFYGREWWRHSGPVFFARAYRVAAYGGVVAMRIQREREQSEPEPEDVPDVLDMANDPAYAGLVEVG